MDDITPSVRDQRRARRVKPSAIKCARRPHSAERSPTACWSSSSRSTSHTGTTTIAPVSRMRPTWRMSLNPSSTICLARADRLGKQRRRVEAESLENDPDDERDDDQPQRRPSPAIRRGTGRRRWSSPKDSDQPNAPPPAGGRGRRQVARMPDRRCGSSIRPSETARSTMTLARKTRRPRRRPPCR